MSSVSWSDNSCMLAASAMSCKAMSELAIKEWDQNSYGLSYQVVNPTCEGYHNISDKGVESLLQKGASLSRQLCFTHDPSLKAGDYFQQIENRRHETFEEWTRRKDISGPYAPVGNEPTYDLDYAFYNCGPDENMKCVYNDGNTIQRTFCPRKCAVHPAPCPNPIR